MKLSRPAWNNVLILATVIMILAFNGVHKKLLSNAEEANQYIKLISQESMLLGVDYGHWQLERIGRSWRAKGKVELTESELQELAENWQLIETKPLSEQALMAYQDVLKQQPWVVTLWLAGEEKGQVIEFYRSEQQFVVKKNQSYSLLPEMSFTQIMPGV